MTVLLDMPGDESAVDVYARKAAAVSADLIRRRLAKYGTAVRSRSFRSF